MNVPDLGAAGDLPCVAGDRPSRQDYSSSYLPEEVMNLDYWFLFVLFCFSDGSLTKTRLSLNSLCN